MKELLTFVFWFGVGYLTVTKVAPYVQAKIESQNLDATWRLMND